MMNQGSNGIQSGPVLSLGTPIEVPGNFRMAHSVRGEGRQAFCQNTEITRLGS